MRIIKKILLVLLLIILGGLFYLIHFYVPRFIVEIKHPLIESQMEKYRPKNLPDFRSVQPRGKYIEFTTKDDLKLSGYLSYSNLNVQKGTIILLHGIRSMKEQWINASNDLANEGFNSIAIDLRGHGQSQGIYCTFGVKERNDISSLIDFLLKTEDISDNYGVWGMSLGGAIALQSMATDKRIQFGIAESTFSNFRTIALDYFEHNVGFRWDFLANYLVSRSGSIAEFDEDDANPKKYCSQITQPILMLHGEKDGNISIEYGEENFSSLKSLDKTWVSIENGLHNGLSRADPDTYFSAINSFLKKISVLPQ